MPAAVNQTEINIEMSWANLMEVEVLRMLRYCKMSGTVISLSALKNLRPENDNKHVLGVCPLMDNLMNGSYLSMFYQGRWIQKMGEL